MDGPDITALLRQAQNGDRVAENSLYELVYLQLRQRAHRMLRGDSQEPVLSSGTIVHESFEKLFRGKSAIEWQDRAHFYCIAARAMRQVIIEHARARSAQGRGGGKTPVSLDSIEPVDVYNLSVQQVLTVGQLCERLAKEAPKAAEVIDLRFFGGLTIPEAAEVLNVSETIISERQRFATAFLRREFARTAGDAHAS